MVCMDNEGALIKQQEVTAFLFSNSVKARQVRPETSSRNPALAKA